MHHHLPPKKHPLLHIIATYSMSKSVYRTTKGLNEPYNKPFTGKHTKAAPLALEILLFIQSCTLPRAGTEHFLTWWFIFLLGIQIQQWYHIGSLNLDDRDHHLPAKEHPPCLHLIATYIMSKNVHKSSEGLNEPYNKPFTGKHTMAAPLASEMLLFIQSRTLPRSRCQAPHWLVYFSSGDSNSAILSAMGPQPSLVHIHLQLMVLKTTQSKKRPMLFQAWPPTSHTPGPDTQDPSVLTICIITCHRKNILSFPSLPHILLPKMFTRQQKVWMDEPYNKPFWGKARVATRASQILLFIQSFLHVLNDWHWAPCWLVYFSAQDSNLLMLLAMRPQLWLPHLCTYTYN